MLKQATNKITICGGELTVSIGNVSETVELCFLIKNRMEREQTWIEKEIKKTWDGQAILLVCVCVKSVLACTLALFGLCFVIPLWRVDPLSLYSHPPSSPLFQIKLSESAAHLLQMHVSSLLCGGSFCVPAELWRWHCCGPQGGCGLSVNCTTT